MLAKSYPSFYELIVSSTDNCTCMSRVHPVSLFLKSVLVCDPAHICYHLEQSSHSPRICLKSSSQRTMVHTLPIALASMSCKFCTPERFSSRFIVAVVVEFVRPVLLLLMCLTHQYCLPVYPSAAGQFSSGWSNVIV